jgi:putative membrane protein
MAGQSRWLAIGVALSCTALIFGVLVWWHPTALLLWLKGLHIIAVIAWMAGMLYLPRLFVYHCEAEPGSRQSETFKIMERRLLRAIINPAMVATWGFGLWLAFEAGLFTSTWM